MVEIRRTTEADAEALRTVRLAALVADPTAFGAVYDEVVAYPAEVWAERAIGNEAVRNFLAFDDAGNAVGLVAGIEHADAPGRVELAAMWTAPATRGLGVGQALVEQVIAWAADRGTPEIRLWVTRGNDPAVRLYERCGFELTNEVGVSPSDPCREELRMCRLS